MPGSQLGHMLAVSLAPSAASAAEVCEGPLKPSSY